MAAAQSGSISAGTLRARLERPQRNGDSDGQAAFVTLCLKVMSLSLIPRSSVVRDDQPLEFPAAGPQAGTPRDLGRRIQLLQLSRRFI